MSHERESQQVPQPTVERNHPSRSLDRARSLRPKTKGPVSRVALSRHRKGADTRAMRLLVAVAFAGTLVLAACSSSEIRPQSVPSGSAPVPSVVGQRYQDAIATLSSAGFCVDRVEMLDPKKIHDHPGLQSSVVMGQQPGPVQGETYPYRVTLQIIGAGPDRRAILDEVPGRCSAPVVTYRLSNGPWYIGTPAEQATAREPAS
jgi:hypothetical protein